MGDMRPYRDGEEDENEDGEAEGFGGAAEAVSKMLKRRGYSRKINYEAVNKVYEPSSRGSVSVVGAGSPGNGNLGARSPDVGSPSAGPSAGEAGSPDGSPALSMLTKGVEKRKKTHVRVTTPGGTSRSTGPTTPATAITPPSTQTQEVGGEKPAHTTPIPPTEDPTTTAPVATAVEEEENEDDDDPDDYFHDDDIAAPPQATASKPRDYEEGGDEEEEVDQDEDDIEAILAEVHRKGDEYDEEVGGDYDED